MLSKSRVICSDILKIFLKYVLSLFINEFCLISVVAIIVILSTRC